MIKASQTAVNEMLAAGFIEPATSDWASLVVLVFKKNGALRLWVDYQQLKTRLLLDTYSLALGDDCIDSLGDAVDFSVLHCNCSYWQTPVGERANDKTTFTTHLC